MLFIWLVVWGLLVESYLLHNAFSKAKPDCAVFFTLRVGDIHARIAQPAALSFVRLAKDLLYDSLGLVPVNGINGFGVHACRPGKGLTHGLGWFGWGGRLGWFGWGGSRDQVDIKMIHPRMPGILAAHGPGAFG